MIRGLLSAAPLAPTQATAFILSGAGGLYLSLVTMPGAGVPPWLSGLVAVIASLVAIRGAIGLSGLRGTFRGMFGRRGWSGRTAPRTQAEVDQVLATKPGGWEFFYMSGLLILGRERVEPKYLDYKLRYKPVSPVKLTADQASGAFLDATSQALRIIQNFDALFAQEAMEGAVGQPGEPGDPPRIEHLATRWNDTYEALIDWANRLRSTETTPRYQPVLDALANLLDKTIHNYRELVDLFARQVEKIPAALRSKKGDFVIDLPLELEIGDEAVEAVTSEIERLANDPE